MKVYRKGKLIKETTVHTVLCGIRIDEVRLDADDFKELHTMSDPQRALWTERLMTRFSPLDKADMK